MLFLLFCACLSPVYLAIVFHQTVNRCLICCAIDCFDHIQFGAISCAHEKEGKEGLPDEEQMENGCSEVPEPVAAKNVVSQTSSNNEVEKKLVCKPIS